MKKFTAISLFICLSFPFLGSYLWLTVSREKIRREIRQQIRSGIPREELVLLTFTAEESRTKLRWENPDEFEFSGQMYDIVETETCRDLIRYFCIPDHRETGINLKIRKLVAGALDSSPQNMETTKRMITFLQISYLPDHFRWAPELAASPEKMCALAVLDCFPGFANPAEPPPKTP